jgi:hypothetical protein
VIPLDAQADVGAFAYRLSRLDPLAVVRLRPVGHGRVQLWGMLPFKVLATRTIATDLSGDVTLAATDLLARLEDPRLLPPVRRDSAWLWPLPPATVPPVEGLPVDEVVGLARAAEETLRTASTEGVGDRPVGERVLRDALLDHVAVVVTAADGRSIELPQRLVQGLVRMNFHGNGREGLITVRASGSWRGLSGEYGSTWLAATSPLRLS